MAQSMDSNTDGFAAERDYPSDSERRRSLQGAEEGQPERWTSGAHAEDSRQRWLPIQAGFVDDPQGALRQAHGLVQAAVQDAVRRLEGERDQLEQSWSREGEVSTEDLRRALQRYRELYGRLLGAAFDQAGPS